MSKFGEISDKNVNSLLKKKTPTFCDRLFLFSLTCIRYTPVPFSTFKLFKHFTCSNNSGRPKNTSSQEKFSLRMTLFCMTSQNRKKHAHGQNQSDSGSCPLVAKLTVERACQQIFFYKGLAISVTISEVLSDMLLS